jgi:hypothetical protein
MKCETFREAVRLVVDLDCKVEEVIAAIEQYRLGLPSNPEFLRECLAAISKKNPPLLDADIKERIDAVFSEETVGRFLGTGKKRFRL